jgi:putative chitinase
MWTINREIFFDHVRKDPFGGVLNQGQVDGMSALLTAWTAKHHDGDLRQLAYVLATTYHETSATMQPIEEYGKGSGMSYGQPDPVTGHAYYGRGYCQLTWADNYKKVDAEFQLADDQSCYLHPERQLEESLAARTIIMGMDEGWFRGDKLDDYFNASRDDPYGAREIINGDKTKVPSWADGASIGELIAEYHEAFEDALMLAVDADPHGDDDDDDDAA